jgi:PIN domain nuclease of toxin-antitoxin system
VLVDACALIVFYVDAGRGMSPAGLEAMNGRALISPITVWEITRKVADGKLPPVQRAGTPDLGAFLAERGFEPAPLTWETAALANALPPHHRDPMDRLLIATAMTLRVPILTSDRVFAAYGVPTLW